MHHPFRMFAAYNEWANRMLYQEVATLTNAEFRALKGG